MDISCVDEHGRNPVFKNQSMQIWSNQQANNFADQVKEPEVIAHFAPQVNPVINYRTHHQPGYNEGTERLNPMAQDLTDINQQLFSDTQVPYMDQNYYIDRVNSLENLVNLSGERENSNNTAHRVVDNYGREIVINQGCLVLNANMPLHYAARQFTSRPPLSAMPLQAPRPPLMMPPVPQPTSMMPPQLPVQNMHLTTNSNSFYPSTVSDGIMEGFPNADTINRANNWH